MGSLNEPNIFTGKRVLRVSRYTDFAVDGTGAIPSAGVGGPHTAGGPEVSSRAISWRIACGTNYEQEPGSPLDFVAFHAKGSPRLSRTVTPGWPGERTAERGRGFATVASFPSCARPIVIGECDPEGCAIARAPAWLSQRHDVLSYTAAVCAAARAGGETWR
jgi:xylan 1,4-beta-xylosidase